MQNRPDLKKFTYLQKLFTGTSSMGLWQVWISMGNYIDFQGGRNKLHQHSYYEACIVLEGEGKFYHGRQVYRLKQGVLFIADPGIAHEIVSSGKNHLKIQFISFSFQQTDREINAERDNETNNLYYQYISTFLNRHDLLASDCEILESQFNQLSIISKTIHHGEWYLQSENIARSLVLKIIIITIKKEILTNSTRAIDSRLQIALRYMQDNPMSKLTIDEIARQACTSTRTLRRLIKKSLRQNGYPEKP